MEVKFNSYDNLVELNAARVALEYLIHNFHEDIHAGADEMPDPLESAGAAPPISTAPPPPPNIPQPPTAVPDTTPPPPPTANDLDHDNNGCPWDERIHSSGKTKTTAGKWVRRRGITDDDYRVIMQEITDPNFDPSVPFEEPLPDPVATFSGNGADAMEWPDVVQKVMTAKLTDVITQEQVDNVVAGMGVEGGFNAMVQHPNLYPQLMIELGL